MYIIVALIVIYHCCHNLLYCNLIIMLYIIITRNYELTLHGLIPLQGNEYPFSTNSN